MAASFGRTEPRYDKVPPMTSAPCVTRSPITSSLRKYDDWVSSGVQTAPCRDHATYGLERFP